VRYSFRVPANFSCVEVVGQRINFGVQLAHALDERPIVLEPDINDALVGAAFEPYEPLLASTDLRTILRSIPTRTIRM